MSRTYSILSVRIAAADCAVARSTLTKQGHRLTAEDGLGKALSAVEKETHDLVFLRPAPDSSNFNEVQSIKKIRPSLPIIIVLSNPTAVSILEAWHAGADDVIPLPFTDQSLLEGVHRAMAEPETDDGPRARFRHLDSTGKEHWTTILMPQFSIGRSSNNDLVLVQMNVSRTHAEVTVDCGEFWMRDLGSKHGTFLNGNRIEKAKLSPGDRIQVGGLQGQGLTFHQGDLLDSLLGVSSKTDVSLGITGFREISKLLSTLRALSSIPLLDDLLALVVDNSVELTGADRGFIMLKNDSGELEFRCARNSYKRPLESSDLQTSRRVPDEVFETGKRMVINDLDFGDSPENHHSTRRLGVRSIFCLPLRYLAFQDSGATGMGRMDTIGVLYVDSQRVGTGLSNTALDALETLASEAAMAIYNARLYKESQEKRKMDEQLAIAREIQQALLPPSNKVLPYVSAHSHNIPCHEVGGDYLDYFDFEDGRLGFTLGDVSGKGMPAALLTSVIQGIFSSQTLLGLPLPAILANVNKNLVKRGVGNRFVTLFFGVLDAEGHCVYTNAGHNPPLLLRGNGSLVELKEGGMVLGLFDWASYETGRATLEPGDRLVLFTDGVLEALDKSGEEFGEERLHALLKEHVVRPASEILDKLNDAVLQFSAGAPQHDDITMMILGYRENSGLAPQ